MDFRVKLKLTDRIYENLDPYLIFLVFTSNKTLDDPKNKAITKYPQAVQDYCLLKYQSLSYERLEFLGDSLLELLMAEVLISNGINNMGLLKQRLVDNSSLNCVAKSYNLCNNITLPKQCADYVESLIGAVYVHLMNNLPSSSSSRPFAHLKKWFVEFFQLSEFQQALDQQTLEQPGYAQLNPSSDNCMVHVLHSKFPSIPGKNNSLKITGDRSHLQYIEHYLDEKNVLDIQLTTFDISIRKAIQLILTTFQIQDIDPYLLLMAITNTAAYDYLFNTRRLNKTKNRPDRYDPTIMEQISDTLKEYYILKYNMIDNRNLQILGKNLITLIITEISYFKYQCKSPEDFALIKDTLNNKLAQEGLFSNVCDGLAPIFKQAEYKNCRDIVLSIIGAIYYTILNQQPNNAYEQMQKIVLNLFDYDRQIYEILTSNLSINSYQMNILTSNVMQKSVLDSMYRKLASTSPLFQSTDRRSELINKAKQLSLDMEKVQLLSIIDLEHLIMLHEQIAKYHALMDQ
jgi:dsRNA-specific ribonuclease